MTAVFRRGSRGFSASGPARLGDDKIRLAEAISGQRIDRCAFASVIELVIAPGHATGSFRVDVVRSAAGEAPRVWARRRPRMPMPSPPCRFSCPEVGPWPTEGRLRRISAGIVVQALCAVPRGGWMISGCNADCSSVLWMTSPVLYRASATTAWQSAHTHAVHGEG